MAGFLSRLFGKKPAPKKAPPPGSALSFLDGTYTTVGSSNVLAAQYHTADQALMIEYHGGSAYLYRPITEAQAVSFITSGSKGGWVWSHLRVRGPGGDSHAAPGISVTRIK